MINCRINREAALYSGAAFLLYGRKCSEQSSPVLLRIDLISIGLDNENLSGMYIRVTTNSKGTAYYHLVESYRDQGEGRQRTLLSLGRVKDGKLKQLAEAIRE